ncbi:hypothetical protein [Mangrovicoccus algicola]|uniref:Uncharacterized protein n=1 Tax=Mangrovicoccus algicola TaxID=2771008 RepID=A0A8J6Z4C3_9RHOB|nr:hypothetical protein [Mangrovicoccus algicola]MBE3637329.1 hypothetical protein [Mangrovicoccus algicola]
MTRAVPACLALGLLGVIVALDLAAAPPNPYRAPAAFALGSGTASAGGFCGALPD